MQPLLAVENLRVVIESQTGNVEAVRQASFEVKPGQTFALLGESGSGKSVTALSILQLLQRNALFGKDSRIVFRGLDLLDLPEYQMRDIRGRDIAMIFQEPMTSMNPIMTIGAQIAEVLRLHQGMKSSKSRQETCRLLELVNIADSERIARSYPHQLSGGMRQRAMIAMALAGRPKLLIADEPTTALDVTTQAQIITLMQQLQAEFGMAILFITHDIALASSIATDVAIMQSGEVVEQGNFEQVLKNPKHLYTRRLLAASPKEQKGSIADSGNNENNKRENEVLLVQNLKVYYPIKKGLFRRTVGFVKAVDDVSFVIREGETLALVGESGSGKTTLGKTVMSLIQKTSGTVCVLGEDLSLLSQSRLRKSRSEFQIIFQDPFSAMDPRMRIRSILLEGMLALNIGGDAAEREERIDYILQEVGLKPEFKFRFPHELSGGQRQRVCIARALCLGPRLLVLDEPTSNLDVSVQAQTLDLLLRLQKEFDLSYLFITHNMAIVQAMAHSIAVMKNGRMVEYGGAEEVLQHPAHPYTKELLAASHLHLKIADIPEVTD